MFRKRVLSNIIDMGILMVAVWIYGIVMMMLINFVGDAQLSPILWIFEAICILGPVLKDVILGDRSIGKKIMGLKVITKDGNKPSLSQLIIRNLFYFIWPVEAVLLLLDRERLGDRKARTAVVKE